MTSFCTFCSKISHRWPSRERSYSLVPADSSHNEANEASHRAACHRSCHTHQPHTHTLSNQTTEAIWLENHAADFTLYKLKYINCKWKAVLINHLFSCVTHGLKKLSLNIYMWLDWFQIKLFMISYETKWFMGMCSPTDVFRLLLGCSNENNQR